MTRVLAWCALLMWSCGPVDLLVVNVADAGDLPAQTGTPCSTIDDCAAGQFCEKTACTDTVGRCAARPQVMDACPNDFRPECGCDRVQYLNDCFRRYAGIPANQDRGACVPRECDVSSPCPDGAYCARLVFPNECNRVSVGQCWVVPDTACMNRDHFLRCGAPAECLDFCTAVRSEQPMARQMGPCP